MFSRIGVIRIRPLALALGLILTLALTPGLARAHAAFVTSQPEPGQRLPAAPGLVALRFTEPMNTRFSRATVLAPDGQRFDGRASGEQEIQVRLSTSAPGIYAVDWTTVSTVDGHTLHGAYRFGVQVAPGEGAEGSTAVEPQWPDLLIAVGRTVEYAALLMAVGLILLGRLAARTQPLTWVQCRLQPPLAAACLSGQLVVLGEAFVAAGSPSLDALGAYLASGLPGVARLLRPVAEILALQLSLFRAWAVAPPLAVAIVTLAAAGHAAAVQPAWWGITADTLHLVATGLWAGGILALATLRPPGGWRGAEGWKLLQRFTPVALGAFFASVAFGTIRSFQELGNIGDLLSSSYGQVLTVKLLGVLAMVPLSFLAWRRRWVAPRLEAPLTVLVIGAAALLAAHPLPPARAGEAEAATERSQAGSALPEPGDLTLGGDAGQVLVGLTLRPAQPGRNEVLVHLLPIEGEPAAAGLPAQLEISGRALDLAECGPACRRAEVDLDGGEQIEVRIVGLKGGSAAFQIPRLPAPDGTETLERMRARMQQLKTLRQDEDLGPLEPPLHSVYAFQAPDRMRLELGNGSQMIWIGGTRYTRDQPSAAWQMVQMTFPLSVPVLVWEPVPKTSDSSAYVAPRIVGTANLEGVDTQILSFFLQQGESPAWFRLWVGADGLVHRAEMRAQGHFMDQRYSDFDAPFTIESPAR